MSSWVCDRCHSINPARHETCYSCHQDREMEAPQSRASGPESWRGALSDPRPSADAGVAYTGVVLRGVAFAIDATIILGVLAVLVLVPMTRSVAEAYFLPILIGLAAIYLFTAWGEFGTTVGMRLFGLSVVRAKGGARLGYERAFLRLVTFAASFALMPVFLIVVTILIDSRRRALHDHAAGSVVIRPTTGRIILPGGGDTTLISANQ